MKILAVLVWLMLFLPVAALAQGNYAGAGYCSNKGSNWFVQDNPANAPPVCAQPSGSGGSYPNGGPPQVAGFSATNTAEAETVTGDCTFTRAGANSYTIACPKSGGIAFGTAAFVNTGTSGGTLGLLSGNLTFGGSDIFSNPPTMSGANIATSSIPNTSVLGLGTFATQNYATPPAIGLTTPAAADFTNVKGTGTGYNGGYVGDENNRFTPQAYGAACNGDGTTDDIVHMQAAYDAACTVAQIPGVVPEFYVPYGNCQEIATGLAADCSGGSVELVGDGTGPSHITALGPFVAVNETATSAYEGLGPVSVASLIGASNPAWNFAQGTFPVGGWWGNLGHVLFPTSGGVANQLSGLAGMAVTFYIKPATLNGSLHTITKSSNLTGDGTHVANTSLNVSFTNSVLTGAVNTGSTRTTSPTSATGALSSNTLAYAEFDADCGNTGYMVWFYGTPGGTTTHGTPVACTGNVLQELNEEWDIAQPSPGSVVAGPNMQGAIADFRVEKVALHTCPSGTCTNFTAPNTDYAADGNTLVLGPNGTVSHAGQVEAFKMAFPVGAQMPIMSDSPQQDSNGDISGLTITSPTLGILAQLRPNSTYENLNIFDGSNTAYSGIQLYNNVYNSQGANILIDNAGRFGYMEQNDSSMFTWRLRTRFALTDYLGTGILDKCEITIGGPATIMPVVFQTNQGVLPPITNGCEIDDETADVGPIFYFDLGVPVVFEVQSGRYGSNGAFPIVDLPVGNSNFFNLGFHDAFMENTNGTPLIGNVGGNTRVTFDNISYNDAGPPTATQGCGSAFASNCFVLNQPPAAPIYGVPPVPAGSPTPVLGTSSSPAVVTSPDTTSGDWQVVFAGAFNGAIGTLPSGWIEAPGCPGDGGAVFDKMHIFIHHNGGSEPSTNSFPFSTGSWDFYPIGVHNTSGPDGQAVCTASNVNTVVIPAPSGTINPVDTTFALGGLSGGGTTSVTFSGATASTWNTSVTSYHGLGVSYTGSGVQVTYTGVGGSATDNIGGQIAFAPVQAGFPLIMSGAQPAVGVGLRPPEFTVSTLPATCTPSDEVRVTDYAAIATIQACSGHGSGTGKVPAVCQPSNVWECF